MARRAVRGGRLEAQELSPDPWRNLAAAIVQRAVDDILGRQVYELSAESLFYWRGDAFEFLRAGAYGLLLELGIDEQAMRATVARWEHGTP